MFLFSAGVFAAAAIRLLAMVNVPGRELIFGFFVTGLEAAGVKAVCLVPTSTITVEDLCLTPGVTLDVIRTVQLPSYSHLI